MIKYSYIFSNTFIHLTLKVFFISIDPERDSPEIIKDYLDSFENKFYGITGDSKKIFLLLYIMIIQTEIARIIHEPMSFKQEVI